MAQIELNYKRKKSSTTETQIDLMNLKGKLRFPKLLVYTLLVLSMWFSNKHLEKSSVRMAQIFTRNYLRNAIYMQVEFHYIQY